MVKLQVAAVAACLLLVGGNAAAFLSSTPGMPMVLSAGPMAQTGPSPGSQAVEWGRLIAEAGSTGLMFYIILLLQKEKGQIRWDQAEERKQRVEVDGKIADALVGIKVHCAEVNSRKG
ncbi:MAG: hypothetical protein WC378_00025 [Opitutaceae bacterium]|jgi:hypothetical protein